MSPPKGRELARDDHRDQLKNRSGYLCPHGGLAPLPLLLWMDTSWTRFRQLRFTWIWLTIFSCVLSDTPILLAIPLRLSAFDLFMYLLLLSSKDK
jgi:hypothetical protein